MKALCLGFKRVSNGQTSFEDMRDSLRKKLHQKDKNLFPYSNAGTSVSSLAVNMLSCRNLVSFSYSTCSHCGFKGEDIPDRVDFVLHPPWNPEAISVWLNSLQHETNSPGNFSVLNDRNCCKPAVYPDPAVAGIYNQLFSSNCWTSNPLWSSNCCIPNPLWSSNWCIPNPLWSSKCCNM
jgi:hypothetical protein